MYWNLQKRCTKIIVNTKGYDMQLESKNLSIAVRFIGKTTKALNLKYIIEFDDVVKTFEVKPIDVNSLLEREWELSQLSKPI